MNLKKALAGTAMAATLATGMPLAAAADGAASTRNIILGGALATYLIVQHNRKVHERYAEDARRQAVAQESASNAWAAYSAEHRAYQNQVAANADLKREIAYQHSVVVAQQHQLALNGISYVAPAQPKRAALKHAAVARTTRSAKSASQVAMVSYGWGKI